MVALPTPAMLRDMERQAADAALRGDLREAVRLDVQRIILEDTMKGDRK